MKSRFTHTLSFIALTCGMLAMSVGRGVAQTDQDLIEVARSVIKVNRQATVVAALEMTEVESKGFWPLYQEYRAEMDKVADGQTKLILEYASLYPQVPDDRAEQLLKDYINLQQQQVNKRASYLKKFGRVLPAAKALRFAQVETRLDLLVYLQLAAAIPLVPVNSGP